MKWKDYVWPVVGLAAVGFSGWLLYGELRDISAKDVIAGFEAIPLHQWLLAACGAIVAYAALAGYDHIALAAASVRGIAVANCAGCNNHSVSELAFGMMLSRR